GRWAVPPNLALGRREADHVIAAPRAETMAYTLDLFCSDLQALLQSEGRDALPQLARKLEILLANPDFVATTFDADTPPGKRVLFHDPASDAYVLAHVQQAGKGGRPHSHGASWAIYGNALGYTEMIEWRRVNPASEGH